MSNFLTNLFRFRKKRDPVRAGEQEPVGSSTAIPAHLIRMVNGEYVLDIEGTKYISRDIYDLALARACINKIATECSKASPQLAKHSARIEYFCCKYPNPYQTMSQFIYQLVTVLLSENNAYVVPILDEVGRTAGFWVANPSDCQIVDVDGDLWLKYHIGEMKDQIIEYELVGHLRRMQNKSTLCGEDNAPFKKIAALYEQDLDKSISKLSSSEAPLQWMGKLNVPLIDDEALREEQARIATVNLTGNNTGFFVFDSRYEQIDPVTKEVQVLQPEDLKEMRDIAYSYWGVSEKLMQNTYSEDEWNGFYQSAIEPLLIQIEEVLTRVVYTRGQIMDGNKLEMASNRLQYASIRSRVDVAFGTYDRGMATMDSALEILNLP
ncbi:phage portal protein, partial [Faecalibaculum rodentium]